MASSHTSHIYALSSLADPLYASTHNTGFLHAFCAAVQGLRDLDQQLGALRHERDHGVEHVVALRVNAPRVFVPLDVRVVVKDLDAADSGDDF